MTKLRRFNDIFKRVFSIKSSQIESIKHEPKLPSEIMHPIHGYQKLSYVKGFTNKPLILDSIGKYWEKQVHTFQNKELIFSLHQNIRWSWKDVDKQANGLARGLISLGFQKGDRLGIWLPNDAEWLVCQIATAKMGVILVNLNTGYRQTEIIHSINLAGIKGIIITPSLKNCNYMEILETIIPNISSFGKRKIQSDVLPSLQYIIHTYSENIPGTHKYYDVIGNTERFLDETINPEEPINIQFTSGTSGQPKGATLTHKNILNNGYFTGEGLNMSQEHIVCICVPLFHCFGCVMGNLATITHGSRAVYPARIFDPLLTLEAIQKERCTTLYGVPTMFITELQHLENSKFDLSSLKNGIMAGSPCPIEIMKKVIGIMNLSDMTICYGMTETSPVSFQTNASDPINLRCETVGTVHDHLDVKIINKEGDIVKVGEIGELCTRGYSVMKGYWKDNLKTMDAIDNEGWMHTGDLATIDQNGYCRIVGRLKDMIIRGGENIYPREVEEFLYTHPNIADVQVIGVPDKIYGEEVCACIIEKKNAPLTEDSIRNFCKGKIAHYKIPKYIYFVESFPMTVSGKVQKYKLIEMITNKLLN